MDYDESFLNSIDADEEIDDSPMNDVESEEGESEAILFAADSEPEMKQWNRTPVAINEGHEESRLTSSGNRRGSSILLVDDISESPPRTLRALPKHYMIPSIRKGKERAGTAPIDLVTPESASRTAKRRKSFEDFGILNSHDSPPDQPLSYNTKKRVALEELEEDFGIKRRRVSPEPYTMNFLDLTHSPQPSKPVARKPIEALLDIDDVEVEQIISKEEVLRKSPSSNFRNSTVVHRPNPSLISSSHDSHEEWEKKFQKEFGSSRNRNSTHTKGKTDKQQSLFLDDSLDKEEGEKNSHSNILNLSDSERIPSPPRTPRRPMLGARTRPRSKSPDDFEEEGEKNNRSNILNLSDSEVIPSPPRTPRGPMLGARTRPRSKSPDDFEFDLDEEMELEFMGRKASKKASRLDIDDEDGDDVKIVDNGRHKPTALTNRTLHLSDDEDLDQRKIERELWNNRRNPRNRPTFEEDDLSVLMNSHAREPVAHHPRHNAPQIRSRPVVPPPVYQPRAPGGGWSAYLGNVFGNYFGATPNHNPDSHLDSDQQLARFLSLMPIDEFDPYDDEFHPDSRRPRHRHRSNRHHLTANRSDPLFHLQFRDLKPEDYDALLQLDEKVDKKSKAATKSEIKALKSEKISQGSEGETKCSICLDDFKPGVSVTRLPCNHVFDASCIEEWLKVSRTCPICKIDIRDVSGGDEKGSEGIEAVSPKKGRKS